MQILYQERYRDFTVKHFHQQLQKRHNDKLSYTVTRLVLQGAGLVAKQKRRGGAYRQRRERRPLPGMLLFQDGWTHRWIGALDHELDLVVTLDDATGAMYSAFLVEEEGRMSSFRGLFETIAAPGLFRALYTDPGSHYFHTPKPAHTEGWRESRQDPADPSRPGALPARDQPHPVLLDRGPRPHGARVRHDPEPPAAGAAALRDRHRRGRQPLSKETLRARLQCPLRSAGGRGRLGLYRLCWPAARGRLVHPGQPPGGPRQLGQLEWPSACKSRRSAIATTTSKPRSGCTDTRTAGWPSSTGRAAWHASTRAENQPTFPAPVNSARRFRPMGLW
ncbi:MAG: hypothetical protein ACM3JG_19310 [Thiohalocapsa sp.]